MSPESPLVIVVGLVVLQAALALLGPDLMSSQRSIQLQKRTRELYIQHEQPLRLHNFFQAHLGGLENDSHANQTKNHKAQVWHKNVQILFSR